MRFLFGKCIYLKSICYCKNMSDDHEDGAVDLYWDEKQLKGLKSVLKYGR